MHVQVTVEQLIDRRARARVTPLADLREKPDADRIRPPLSIRPRRDNLLEVMPTAADRVRAGIDTHSQGAAGQRLDTSASTATAACSLGDGSTRRHSHHAWCHVTC